MKLYRDERKDNKLTINSSTAAWIRFLRNYGPIPTNDNMYDESIQRALKRHAITPIKLPAPLIDKLVDNFKSPAPISQIVTGTAGDGKTYHCREVWMSLGGDPALWDKGGKIQTLPIGVRSLVIVKDLSELQQEESASLIARFAHDVMNPSATTNYLLAANHGQLLEKLKSAKQTEEVIEVSKAIEEMLVTGINPNRDVHVKLTDLGRSPAAKLLNQIIDTITHHDGWQGCKDCSANNDTDPCPILENRRRLMANGPEHPFRSRLTALIELSEYNSNHFPVRQLLALVANSILGHPDVRDRLMTCDDVPDIQKNYKTYLASIYRNIFGDNLSRRKVEKTELFRKLNAFGIGFETSNQVDNLLVYGADDPGYHTDYETLLLSDKIYGATPAYVSAQHAYLEGTSNTNQNNFLSELRAQRQRLFFTMPNDMEKKYSLWHLTVFHYAGIYLDVVEKIIQGQAVPRRALNMIVRGLNRIFTGMLVQNHDKLVLASSGSYSQSTRSPLLDELISVPRHGGESVSLGADETHGVNIVVRLMYGDQIPPITLELTPTRFEFLGRVSEGALPSSFSLECHEDFLAFKARLLGETQKRREIDGEDQMIDGELVLRFIDLNNDGLAVERRVVVRV
ncbi:hypothetical protein BJI49_02700 [Acetobacter pasteurianus]|uniref:hypothetical protein n=1 Tax=Acetobacter pasteurianus TaxID=438 RepID=UPI0002457979|nr:hypothetical protein [Acetobacter pasteurianus]RCL09693.1 hypothetical protein BJI49_02700 [Acetobacter pasteurianus]GAB31746.1 hypothetical protein APS_2348 [Acetobacter pasteurianus subsp. pasteurianus LMG 1262 = NBRC 106471]GCD50582.1 hypothetical protein NBRC106471_2138 [Acetobacter pasteurianus subsp. pasteurianus LMG 1262 = NBRC 106471]